MISLIKGDISQEGDLRNEARVKFKPVFVLCLVGGWVGGGQEEGGAAVSL